ncbi:class I ribonucleotide reductase maintenance protein YfaE [Parashewanella tropica]|uniref:class I ribonucleotide reductase maintenance protein YfaE n=1 Tax=Parashewanella tropica TaxID=2547970 RepID=UPI00105A2179|nr:class I ribonucleotide reductase maintenance protein YfaE [Parashewanella tropica]
MNFKKAPIVYLQGKPVLLFDKQATLLEALEEKQIDIFSECRNGFCGSCKTKVISGTVNYIQEPLAVLEEDECLPCCCKPQEDLDLDLAANTQAPLNVED